LYVGLQCRHVTTSRFFVYISNESSANVFFDNLQVRQDRGRIIEENHYYAHGLKIAAISSKAYGAPNNNYGYQGDFSEFDDDLGWNDFELRSYDPQIGRFLQNDPYDQFASGYVGMGNDPVNNIDPSGGWASTGIFAGLSQAGIMGVTTLGGAIIGGAIDLISGGDGSKGLMLGVGIGLASNFGNAIDWGGVGSKVLSFGGVGINLVGFGLERLNNQTDNFALKDVITYGRKGSKKFRELLNQAGINDKNYYSAISFGGSTTTTSEAPYKITLKKGSCAETTLGLAHELTNRINGKFLEKFRTDVGAGTITPEQYALGVLGIEAKGVLNQIIVGSQLNLQPSVAGNQPYFEEYKSGGTTDDALIKKINKNIRKLNLANGGGNAYDSYRKDGTAYREAMKAYEKQMKEYNKKYKKN